MFSGVSFKLFLEKWGYLHGEAIRLLGRFGGMLPRENFKNGAILCVLENILLKFGIKKVVKIFIFYIKIIDNVLLRTLYLGVLEHTYSPDFLLIVQFGLF